MQREKWRVWDKSPEYGELLYKRAVGKLEEMESSKSLCETVRPFYRPGMKVLDVGCGAGHYLRSLRARVDPNIDYTGADATAEYLRLARKAFPGVRFVEADIFQLPFGDGEFDIVMCNNVILHLPPPPTKAFSELIRVSRRQTVIRTLFGMRNYLIKEVYTGSEMPGLSPREGDLIRPDGEVEVFNYFNLYSEPYIRDILDRVASGCDLRIERDTHYKPFDNRTECGDTATAVINGMQISGNIVHDSRFIVVTKK